MPPTHHRGRPPREGPYSRNGGAAAQSQYNQNQVPTIAIQPANPRETLHLNDEVDMYIPRKHVLRKFKTCSDLMNNIFLKPYSLEVIEPPALFPDPVFAGVKLEDKKREIVQRVSGREWIKDHQGKLPELNEEELKLLREFIASELEKQNPNNFVFGDPLSMKMYREMLESKLESLEKEKVNTFSHDESFVYKLKICDEISGKFSKFNAGEEKENTEFVDNLERDMLEKHNMKIETLGGRNVFQTDAFESEIQSISMENWKAMREKKRIEQEQAA